METGLQIQELAMKEVFGRSINLPDMAFSFSKPDFKAGLRASGSMMTGNACVAFLIFDNRNWGNLFVLMMGGLALILLTSIDISTSKGSKND